MSIKGRASHLKNREIPQVRYDSALPIFGKREEIIGKLRTEQVLVIAGETGSGKTTQIPKMCLEAGLAEAGDIVCTQPRRVAALSISRRIAEELGVRWGEQVGAKIRFTDRTSDQTIIKVMTDGMLLSEIQGDRNLRKYSVIIVDEAHERSLNIDFLLGYLKILLGRRPDLKLVITSATIDTKRFSEAFGGAPIIEVSGRMFPVETIYAPVDELLEDSGELTYIEAAIKAIEEIIAWDRPGDVLVFLPGEKDIREAKEILEGRGNSRLNILPLFGRLSSSEQDEIFKVSQRRKVVLSTNIAETSITIPGIRFVVDSGLARISRYSAHTHTRRLPIEKIPQSSADQRKGRAGRLSDGICIRLYSEEDFLAREKYGTPEILRSNLADVILRMIAFKIGEIETFPFVEPPGERAINAGYHQLVELGAIEGKNHLTQIGYQLARLPVDPAVGRMLIEAIKEGSLKEVLVIASGLSIQDPRERPMEAAKAADQMHGKFRHPESDFLTLYNIWEAFHDQMENLKQKQLRKFCKEHFLSYLRMREWRDIHSQLVRVLKDLNIFRLNEEPSEYDQVHRALLTGLLSGVAQWDEGNFYRAIHNRKVMIFPGSGLFRKTVAREKGKKDLAVAEKKSKQKAAEWILSAEFVETSQLYARTNALLKPEWILRVAAHLLKRKYTEPQYREKGERVVVRERVLLYGLEVSSSFIGYSRVNPKEATEIFIREGLVEGRLESRPRFYQHNNELRERLEDVQTRMRQSSGWFVSENLYNFYSERLKNVGSIADLNRFIRDEHGGKDQFLFADDRDLLRAGEDVFDSNSFPDALEIEGVQLNLAYAYKPGEENDGATLTIPVESFEKIPEGLLDWAVPGYIGEKIEHMLRGLPKTYRKQLFPINELIAEVRIAVQPGKDSLIWQVSRLIKDKRNIAIPLEAFDQAEIPAHLIPRIELKDKANKTIASGRQWDQICKTYREATLADFKKGTGHGRLEIWQKAQQKLEKHDLRNWDIPDFDLEIRLGDLAGLPVLAYPALKTSGKQVDLILCRNRQEANELTEAGFFQLCLHAFGRDMGWLEKDMKSEVRRVALAYSPFMSKEQLSSHGLYLISRYIFEVEEVLPLKRDNFEKTMARASERAKGIVPVLIDQLDTIMKARDKVLQQTRNDPTAVAELDALIHGNFLLRADWANLKHYPRYIQAIEKRLQRAKQNPLKDKERVEELLPFLRRFSNIQTDAKRKRHLRWMIEELKVQIFAQELGTAGKISPKILAKVFEEIEQKSEGKDPK